MITIFLVVGVFVVLIILFVPLIKLAKKKGAPPRLWESALLCSWAFIWLSVSYTRKILETYFLNIENRIYAVLILGFLLSIVAYVIVFALLKRKPDLNNFDRKLNEIGKTKSANRE